MNRVSHSKQDQKHILTSTHAKATKYIGKKNGEATTAVIQGMHFICLTVWIQTRTIAELLHFFHLFLSVQSFAFLDDKSGQLYARIIRGFLFQTSS